MIDAPLQTEPQAATRKAGTSGGRSGSPLAVAAAALALLACAALAARIYQQNSSIVDFTAQVALAKSETTRISAELDKAKVQSASLQAQLLAALRQGSDVQAQLAGANASSAELRAQLQKARAQLDDAGTRSAGLQAQLDRANDAATGLRRDLVQATRESNDLRTQLAAAKAKIVAGTDGPRPVAAIEARPMPVATAIEKSFWDRGFTLHIRNLGTDPLSVTIAVTGAARPVSRTASMEGGATLDVGNLLAGENVAISGVGYETVNLAVR